MGRLLLFMSGPGLYLRPTAAPRAPARLFGGSITALSSPRNRVTTSEFVIVVPLGDAAHRPKPLAEVLVEVIPRRLGQHDDARATVVRVRPALEVPRKR